MWSKQYFDGILAKYIFKVDHIGKIYETEMYQFFKLISKQTPFLLRNRET